MSVIVKRLKSSSMEVYVKGAPEVMSEICIKSTCTSISSANVSCSANDFDASSERLR
jgi:magnesium-transporting ATPase (P-type)